MFARRTTLAILATMLMAGTSSAAAQGDAFDAASLENAIKGMRVYRQRMTEIVALRVQYLNVQNRRSEAQNKGQNDVNAFANKQSEFRECVRNKLSNNNAAQAAKMQERVFALANNPTAMQKYADASTAMTNAAAKGDTAAMAKASADLMKILGVDVKADSAAAAAACGGAPKPPTIVAEIERLEKQADSVTIRLRRAETPADVDAARAAGVTPSRFAEMRERLQSFASSPTTFKGKEAELLAARRAEIIALTKEQ